VTASILRRRRRKAAGIDTRERLTVGEQCDRLGIKPGEMFLMTLPKGKRP